eukprot:2713424-Alexandrium_andersonii.AAC.1
MDLSSVSEHWNKTSWVHGFSPEYVSIGVAPNSAAMFRLMVLGEMEVRAMPLTDLLEAFRKLGDKVGNMDDLIAKFSQMPVAKMTALVQSGGLKLWTRRVMKEELVFVPAGWLVCERSVGGQSIYALRKSYFFKSVTAASNYSAAMELLEAGGRGIDKMRQVSGMFANSSAGVAA